jgi:hypothetical protein
MGIGHGNSRSLVVLPYHIQSNPCDDRAIVAREHPDLSFD